jgi:hypothetical protein
MNHKITIQHPSHEVPITVTVTHYWHQEPNTYSWVSADDYHGFTEIEYTVEPVDGIPEEELYSEAVTEAVIRAFEANRCVC